VRLAWGSRRAEAPDHATGKPQIADAGAAPYELSAVDIYTLDGREVAWIATNGERASDMLNRDGEIPLHGVTVADPADETVTFASMPSADDAPTLLVRSNVRFIVPPPLPPNRHLRLHRRRVLIAMRMGPYEVSGQVHVRPGADAGDYLLRSSRSFVPLTDVQLKHCEEPPFSRYLPVVIINVSHVTELIDMERRERSMAAAAPSVPAPSIPAPSSVAPQRVPAGAVLSRLAAANGTANGTNGTQPKSELLGALQLLLDHGIIDAIEFQQKRAALLHRG
jgi:hypothetical protein